MCTFYLLVLVVLVFSFNLTCIMYNFCIMFIVFLQQKCNIQYLTKKEKVKQNVINKSDCYNPTVLKSQPFQIKITAYFNIYFHPLTIHQKCQSQIHK